MSREDEEHTAFIIVNDHFCFVSMPYGDLIRDLVEVCVNDIIIKIKSRASLLDNLALVFERLRSTRMKLNPDKC
jgi:hypothetical protein